MSQPTDDTVPWISIDATALSSKKFRIHDRTNILDWTKVQTLDMDPGKYKLRFASESYADFQFGVDVEGRISYDASCVGFVSGRGTSTLTLHGHSITIDGTELPYDVQPLDFDPPILDRTSAHTLRLLPASSYRLQQPSTGLTILTFGVDLGGRIFYDASYDSFTSGRGTTTLRLGSSASSTGIGSGPDPAGAPPSMVATAASVHVTPADRLYRLLPEVYRARDNGDLRAYLAAFDGVLELFRKALDQKLADAFPETAQGWVLPYLAELLDLKLLSPDDEGRRKEIASAMYWRKRKGTRRAIEQVVVSVGRFGWPGLDLPFVVEEAYPRVLVTPRVSDVLPAPGAVKIPAPGRADPENPRRVARDPGLPMGTVDLRYRSRRVRPASEQPPLQANPHGVPRWPGTVEDVSRRTPDLRAPNWRQGHVHPKRVLIYAAPYPGFFPPGWSEGARYAGKKVRGDEMLDPGEKNTARLEDAIVDGVLTLKSGRLELVRCAVNKVVIENSTASDPPDPVPALTATDCLIGEIAAPTATVHLAGVTVLEELKAGGIVAMDSWVASTLNNKSGRGELVRCAVRTLVSEATNATGEPAVIASDCLFGSIKSASSHFQFAGVTVLGHVDAGCIWASDSSFAGQTMGLSGWPMSRFRYSRVPFSEDVIQRAERGEDEFMRTYRCFDDAPHFFSNEFGTPGCGVLRPVSSRRLRGGAEDGGEVGAYHHLRYAARERALLETLQEELPVGHAAALIPDARLVEKPPVVVQKTPQNP